MDLAPSPYETRFTNAFFEKSLGQPPDAIYEEFWVALKIMWPCLSKKISWLHNWIGCISVGSGPGLQITNVILKTLPKTSNHLSMNCLSFQFLSKHSLNKHHKVAHSDNAKRYPCVTCGQTFAKKSWWATILAVSFLTKLGVRTLVFDRLDLDSDFGWNSRDCYFLR